MSRNLAATHNSASNGLVASLEEVDLTSTDSAAVSRRISFEVKAHELLFLVGPASCGKSAVLDLLSFHRLPCRGRLQVLGADPARLAPADRSRMRRRVGIVFEDQCILPDRNVFANLALPAIVAGRRSRDFAPEISELLVWVGLGGRGSDAITRLTEGEKRRLGLARALVNRPDLLIVDDPTAGLGDKAERAIVRLIADVNAAGTPVVWATRSQALAEAAGGVIYEMPERNPASAA